jgi:hypothetical protein
MRVRLNRCMDDSADLRKGAHEACEENNEPNRRVATLAQTAEKTHRK